LLENAVLVETMFFCASLDYVHKLLD